MADRFNNDFNNIFKTLHILTNKNVPKKKINGINLNFQDLIEPSILKFKNHPSLNASRSNNLNFHFEYTSLDQTLKKLEKLNQKRASQVDDLPFSYTITLITWYQVSLFPVR